MGKVLVTLFSGVRAIFPKDGYVFHLLFCSEDVARFYPVKLKSFLYKFGLKALVFT